MSKLLFKKLYDDYFDAIRRYLHYRGATAEVASDLTQEVFLKIWEKQFDFSDPGIKSLLYKMAGNAFVDFLRKAKHAETYQSTLQLEYQTAGPESDLQYQELQANYEKSIQALPEKQRAVFLMSRVDELTYKEIAERLDIGVKAVEKRMSLAISAIKDQLQVYGTHRQ